MKKKAIAVITTVLPETLQTPIVLKNIQRIEFHHQKHQNGGTYTTAFIRKYIPPMRFYNENFIYKSILTEKKGPKLVIFDKKEQIISEFTCFGRKPESLLKKIQRIDEKASETSKETTQTMKEVKEGDKVKEEEGEKQKVDG